jgi:hexosaminidase
MTAAADQVVSAPPSFKMIRSRKLMRIRQAVFFSIPVLALSCCMFAQSAESATSLKLLPAPKEARLASGEFTITPATHIVVEAKAKSATKAAIETLQEEVRSQGGPKLMETVAGAPGTAIVLGTLADAHLRAELEAKGLKAERDFNAQGYLLYADRTRILVAGASPQGLFYGAQTLRQLLRPQGKGLICPAVAIRDWPSMEWRGVHDDISRGPIPTLDYMKKQIRVLAAYKVNLFALYMEHVFDFKSQPLIAPKEAALTPEQIRELVVYASEYYVTILPEQQTFGHLHHALKYEIYSDLAETPHGHVLTPTKDASYDFIRSLYAELVPLFPGPFLHIGADETFELGHGQTKARVDEVGLGKVYLQHLQKTFEILQPYHKELMFWGDIAVKYPELLSILPKQMIAVPWDYDAKPTFDPILKPYKDAGLRIVVAPGVNDWNVIWPELEVAYVNIRNFVRDGQKAGAIGMLNTTWDDDGESLFDMDWPALIFGASAGWQRGESSIDQFKSGYDWAFYRNGDTTFRDAIANLDRSHAALAAAGLERAYDDLFWADSFSADGAARMKQALPAAPEIRLGAEQALVALYTKRVQAHANADTIDDMIFAAWRLDTLGMKIQFTQELNKFYWDAYQNQKDEDRVEADFEEITAINARLEDLRDATTRLRGMYEKAWLRENRPYWLGNVLVRYDNLASEFQAKIVAVRDAQSGYAKQKTLPPPQQLGFYLQP